ncbi:hypothetical protein LB534_12860 [Mesorhizobium sp. CA18]|uniref:hypothetical protein n=1 Tax=unclassified Mesorhizobium TaxID=325217 RepID=UPI001CCCC4B0|nr:MULTISPECIES: hypothetical protein [unclassified Mesorhizobium]MBZ9732019.1 hypothetical protein [Mesorhizobium sp. CA9]MBZ9826174.1 hypothetical protein [Mesorhizobium sp. CA18]MBZ9829738.1 hypothetical protein [Mesorhizobium sp. CA2]MBZ9839321.1 hypothetical protein [Mesorhizobium sp. CA3]MBZ9876944.1 hypothetical protein [Mesorhizobium sp. Ca11]
MDHILVSGQIGGSNPDILSIPLVPRHFQVVLLFCLEMGENMSVFVLVVIGAGAAGLAGIVSAAKKSAQKKRRALLLAKYGDEEIADWIMIRRIWQGMTFEQLIDSWGKPADMTERVYKTKVAHTLKYNQTGKNRYSDRVIVENGIVVGWDQK